MRSSWATCAPHALFALATATVAAAAAWPVFHGAFPLPGLDKSALGGPFVYERPLHAMVDVTNRLGACILEDNASTGGNFAFSPYGAASVLVVLYEGARGASARQIHEALGLPWDRDVTRVGFRDIHRHLRSYFTYAGYLSGMTLSKNQTALRPEFERLLRFYGYDLDEVMGPATSEPTTTEGAETTTETSANATGDTTVGTTENTNAETTTDVKVETTTETKTGITVVTNTETATESKAETTTETKMDTTANNIAATTGSNTDATTEAKIVTTTEAKAETTMVMTEANTLAATTSGVSPDGAANENEGTSSASEGFPNSPDLTSNAPPSDAATTEASSTSSSEESTSELETSSGVPSASQSSSPSSALTETTESASEKNTSELEESSDSTTPASGSSSPSSALTETTNPGSTNPTDTSPPSSGETTQQSTEPAASSDSMSDASPDSTTNTNEATSPASEGSPNSPDLTSNAPSSDAATTEASSSEENTSGAEASSGVTSASGSSSPSSALAETTETSSTNPSVSSPLPSAEAIQESTVPTTSTDSPTTPSDPSSSDYTDATTQPTEATTTPSRRAMSNVEGEELAERAMAMEIEDPSPGKTTEAGEASAAATTAISQEAVAAAAADASEALAEMAAASEVVSSQNEAAGHGVMMALMDMMREMMPDAPVTESASADAAIQTSPSEGLPAGAEALSVAAGTTAGAVAYAAEGPAAAVTVTTAMGQPVGDAAVAAASEAVAAVAEPEGPVVSPRVGAKALVTQEAASTPARAKARARATAGRRGGRPGRRSHRSGKGARRAARHRGRTAAPARRRRDVPRLEDAWARPALAPAAAVSVSGPGRRPRWLFTPSPGPGPGPAAYANHPRYGQPSRLPFLVNGEVDTPVPVMTFAAVFPYAVIPHLDAQVLEFPLDDERYRLVLVLPRRRRGLAQLLRALRSVPLRHLCAQLLPTRVHAVIPSFMVDDYVTLTASLQKLGIWDVFDPRRADLGVMTDDRELFVRNIEQSITVVIRNYVEVFDIQSRTHAGRSRPERFIALHPFLYFVVDAETSIALIAGKIDDPTDSRIR